MEQGKLVLSRKKGEAIIFETVKGEVFKLELLEKQGKLIVFKIAADGGHKLKLVDFSNESVKIQVSREVSVFDNKGGGVVDMKKAKGVHGVTGDDFFVDGDFLKCNLKVSSKKLEDKINSGTKDLSIGYKSDHILDKGGSNGTAYDLVQANLRNNHISLVDEVRSGRFYHRIFSTLKELKIKLIRNREK